VKHTTTPSARAHIRGSIINLNY